MMERFKIVETDNFGRDYPNESALPLPALTREQAETIANVINDAAGVHHDRFWKVVPVDYKLAPGFQE